MKRILINMNKKEIVKFLEELAIGVSGKRDNYEKQIKVYRNKLLEGAVTRDESQKNMELLRYFQDSLEHIEGQLYEINYILETITRDNRKRDF
ncbi:hypothetical protein M0R04_14430 [Candidatus Dojkabacteria bacterium]|nr:hypothetical protein [Candidatus Dojkabacteria bacterium]